MNIKLISLTIASFLCQVALAQETCFTNYTAMADSMNAKMLALEKAHGLPDINTVKSHVLEHFQLDADAKSEPLNLPKARRKQLTPAQIYQLCKPSTLSVVMMRKNAKETSGYESKIMATAIALTEDGVCLTNFHVVADLVLSGAMKYSSKVEHQRYIMTADGKTYPISKILYGDPGNDWAVIRVNTLGDKLSPIPLGNTAKEGDPVWCLSMPKGYPYVFTEGIVSRNTANLNKKTGEKTYVMEITADYARGSSGGPIIDQYGNLCGMVSSTLALYGDQAKMINFQMSMKKTVPVFLFSEYLTKKD